MQHVARVSHDIAFEWTGRAQRKVDEVVDATLFRVSTDAPAFHVTGHFQPDSMTGSFTAVGSDLSLRFDLEQPTGIAVHVDGERVFSVDVWSGELRTKKPIGRWSRKKESHLEMDGLELARMAVGSGHSRYVPTRRSARIYWGASSWTDLQEVIRLGAVIIDTVFFVAPGVRETVLMFLGGNRDE
jgi:hypothetical protein